MYEYTCITKEGTTIYVVAHSKQEVLDCLLKVPGFKQEQLPLTNITYTGLYLGNKSKPHVQGMVKD